MLAMIKEGDDHDLSRELRLIAGLKLRRSEAMARYTSMKIGGPADYLIEVENEPALRRLLPVLRRHDVPFMVLGNGSNVLISDRGIRGAVLRLTGEFKSAEWREEAGAVWLRAGAACPVAQLVRDAMRKGYGGLEFAEGIPGTVGGAVVMNAGAYGCEFEKIVDHVEGVTQEGAAVGWARAELTFSYRDSHLPAGTVVTRIRIRLHREEAARIKSKIHELVGRRKSSQPFGYPNSGSMFRNPPGDFAGRLIEAAGLKGRRLGQAQISDRHANFIVNLGGAKADDVRALMELARAEVQRRFAVALVPEVRLIGDWRA